VRRRVIKHDRFLIWIFTASYYGEGKRIKPIECNRGLTDYGPTTLNTISVFTKGSWATVRNGGMPHVNKAGTGGSRFLDAPDLDFHVLVALEEGAEYHCITPRDHVARFWERKVQVLKPDQTFWVENEWIYNATTGELVNIQNDFYFVDQESIIARMVEPTVST
jgi:hypothetical protein